MQSASLFNRMTDYHSHLLPGVDDGMNTIEEACEALNFFESNGVERVILTPHIMEDLSLNTPSFLRKRFKEVQSYYQGNIKLRLGAEYMLDSSFAKHLESGDLLTISERDILLETSYMYRPLQFEEQISSIYLQGYRVILAHSERYAYIPLPEYRILKSKGIRFQLNLFSLTGLYGRSVQRKAKWLLENGLYDCMGTDIHRLSPIKTMMCNYALPIKIITQLQLLKEKQDICG